MTTTHTIPTTKQLTLFDAVERPTAQNSCPPEMGSTIAVRMPCGEWALAKILWYYYRNHEYSGGHYPENIIGLRVHWLEPTQGYIRGYAMVWGRKIETIEGLVCFPIDPANSEYGCVQMGEWRAAQ